MTVDEMNLRKRRRFLFLVAPPLFLLFVAVGGLVVQQLWNWLLPQLLGVPRVGFWQALGILALCRILFGGFGMQGESRASYRRRMLERWESMTPEERERARRGWRGRWGFVPPIGAGREPAAAPEEPGPGA